MIEAMHTAIAGLRVNATRLAVAAENIAGMRSSGRAEPYGGYVPRVARQSTGEGGNPVMTVKPADVTFFPVYAPGNPDADSTGVIGMPNVSLTSQFVDISTAQRSYAANLAVLKTTDEMMQLLVDREA